MKKSLWLLPALLLPLAAGAQDDDGPAGFSYVTYYVCDVSTQGNMDNIVAANEAPVFDEWVEDGKMLAWGYLSHFTGGRWRRAQYHVAPTVAEALNNQSAIFNEIYADNREAGQARGQACEAHDDYVWAINQGSPPGTERGSVSLSVYFVCAVADQIRSDEVFAEIYAPILDQMAADGEIASWNWQSHVLGGPYRRLQTVTGSDYATVNAARLQAIQQANESHPELAREFAEICDSHSDYLWDIVHESN